MNKQISLARISITTTVLLVLALAEPRALFAQTCIKCPINANDTAIGTAFGIFVNRDGIEIPVSGEKVGICETLILRANVQYASFGVSGGVGAGFTGGTGHFLFPDGTSTNVTPADMGTTLVTTIAPDPNACTAPVGTTATPVKAMRVGFYILTAADIGVRQFTFQYTNGTSLNPNGQGQCIDKVSASPQQNVMVVPPPKCELTKHCLNATNITGNAVVVTYSGTVSNSGVTTLTNLTILNDQPAPNTTVFTINSLAVGQSATFTNSYTNSFNLCGPWTDVLTVTGKDILTCPVSNSSTDTCSIVYSPAITVTKQCPTNLVAPGGLLTFTGSVSNSGNAVLTNVMVYNDQPAAGTLLIGPITLGLGAMTNFTASYNVPVDSCGPYVDTLTARGTSLCGASVTNTDTKMCPGTNNPSIDVVKTCPVGLIQPGDVVTVTGTLTNTGDITLTNVVVTNTIAALGNVSRRVLGPISLAPGAGTSFSDSYTAPLDSCGPYMDTFAASGADKCFGRIVTDSDTKACPSTNSPSIDVVKTCPVGLIQPGQLVAVTGTVTNTGNITLTNVVVTNTIAALGNLSRRVLGPVSLAPGVGTSFSDSYTAPLDSCGPYVDTFVASGADKCFGRIVTDSDTRACPSTNSPAIRVTKSCPTTPTPPGGTNVISGVVSNAGNITLLNVTVTNVIDAIGQSRLVFGPISLAPGASMTFTDKYIVPLDSCGPYRDTLLASGADKCFGRIVTASDFKDCLGITTPRIAVIKHCPANPVAPGGTAIFSGTVSNAGNITLTNVTVVNNRPTNNTPVFGPVTLAPGQSANFTGSEVVPANCCTYFDTLTATGASKCTGSNVTATASAACPTLINPRLAVTKNCPPAPVPLGQPLLFTGVVSNSGNITLIGVTVVNNQPSNNTPVLGPITLAPGETANFGGSYIVPINLCDTNISDTLTARGVDICAGSNVVANATALCPILPTPRLSIAKHCPPNPVAPGELLVYSGFVSNSGSLTITNVTVVNDRPIANTPVLGPITLAPGQIVNFNGSYVMPYDCCGPCVDTLTARGQDICRGSNVVATASDACPRITTPKITVTRDCPPPPVNLGELVFFTGVVSNSGNATLANVLVVDDQAGVVLDSQAMAPSEALWYWGMYFPQDCGAQAASGVTATANDVCTGTVVSNRFVTVCAVICPPTQPVTIFGARINGEHFEFSFETATDRTNTVQCTDSLMPTNWLNLTNFLGDGNITTIQVSKSNAQRFYRIMIQ